MADDNEADAPANDKADVPAPEEAAGAPEKAAGAPEKAAGAAEDAAGTAEDAAGTAAGDQVAQLALMAQYVKDLSFENPNAPASFQESDSPKIDVSIDVRARRVGEEHYEVELKFAVKASQKETTAFVAELLYGGLFGVRNVPEEHLEALCLIECPRLLFPFARRILADATRDGGFPPLMLDPIDFVTLYRQRKSADGDGGTSSVSAQQSSNPPGNGGGNGSAAT